MLGPGMAGAACLFRRKLAHRVVPAMHRDFDRLILLLLFLSLRVECT